MINIITKKPEPKLVSISTLSKNDAFRYLGSLFITTNRTDSNYSSTLCHNLTTGTLTSLDWELDVEPTALEIREVAL